MKSLKGEVVLNIAAEKAWEMYRNNEILSKINPEMLAGAEYIQGDGSPGSLRHFKLGPGGILCRLNSCSRQSILASDDGNQSMAWPNMGGGIIRPTISVICTDKPTTSPSPPHLNGREEPARGSHATAAPHQNRKEVPARGSHATAPAPATDQIDVVDTVERYVKESTEKIEKVEAGRSVTYQVIGGELKRMYDPYRVTFSFSPLPSSPDKCIAEWKAEFEPLSPATPPPHKAKDVALGFLKSFDNYARTSTSYAA
ncbi:hypothetical protein ACLOJK_008571 [Asimina triloba]